MSWISAAELAKQTGVSRAAVTQAIKKSRIPADAVRRASGRVLIEKSAGMKGILKRANGAPPVEDQAPPMLPADTAELAGLFAWGCAAEPEPPPPDVSHLEREIARLKYALECHQWRQERFQKDWVAFREWVLGYNREMRVKKGGIDEPGLNEQLRAREGDDQRMWAVSVAINEIMLQKLKPLDELELACQFPKEKRTGRL
jgi:DNA-binding transcriptional MocR family regulator